MSLSRFMLAKGIRRIWGCHAIVKLPLSALLNTIVRPINVGRLGNVLFQVAAAMGYAWRHDLEFSVPTTTSKPKSNPIYFQHLANPNWSDSVGQVIIKEQGFPYRDLEWREEWRGNKNIVLDGYWQSEKYFKEFRDDVIKQFGFPWQMEKGVVAVHVRRGDYLIHTQKHPPVTEQWYRKAMALFPGCVFRFFSDDLRWCKQTFKMRDGHSFSEGNNEIDDLVAMSQCEHFICSASTFSWWGAWLCQNPDKRVVMPKAWFVAGWQNADVRDIVPTEWQRL